MTNTVVDSSLSPSVFVCVRVPSLLHQTHAHTHSWNTLQDSIPSQPMMTTAARGIGDQHGQRQAQTMRVYNPRALAFSLSSSKMGG